MPLKRRLPSPQDDLMLPEKPAPQRRPIQRSEYVASRRSKSPPAWQRFFHPATNVGARHKHQNISIQDASVLGEGPAPQTRRISRSKYIASRKHKSLPISLQILYPATNAGAQPNYQTTSVSNTESSPDTEVSSTRSSPIAEESLSMTSPDDSSNGHERTTGDERRISSQPRVSQAPEPRSRLRPSTEMTYAQLLTDTDGSGNEIDNDDDVYCDSDGSFKSNLPDTSLKSEVEGIDDPLNLKSRVTQTKNSKNPRGQATGRSKDVDLSLPPISNIEDSFEAMTQNALSLGLGVAVNKLGSRPIRIGTMCSGTEAPIIALELISKSLEKLGHPNIKIDHPFSWEIEEVKQAFIERNFQPPIIFRDVRDVIADGALKATTAYGSEEEIPRDLDILVAGFVCKDLSLLNNNKKSMEDDGETGDTFRAIHAYANRFRPTIILLENVRSTREMWDETIKKHWDGIDYGYTWIWVDTKNYYLPQTRQRMYMIAVDNRQFGSNGAKVLKIWKETMEGLERRCSSPFQAWLAKDNDSDPRAYKSSTQEPDWVLSKLRLYNVRIDEHLGMKRPITSWNENGYVKPPDWGNSTFFKSQSRRVLECIDIASLRAAKQGYDGSSKMMIYEVSQNVDRFHTGLGVVPCITPNGIYYMSNNHTPLTSRQLLSLQGMPTNLIFGNETEEDIQSLAGNAMSTTVIGASLCSALIAVKGTFERAISPNRGSSHRHTTTFIELDETQDQLISPPNNASINLKELINDAKRSSMYCDCEGPERSSKAPIKECRICGHTACDDCAGNPKHLYDIVPVTHRQRPIEFRRKWRPRLPSTLR